MGDGLRPEDDSSHVLSLSTSRQQCHSQCPLGTDTHELETIVPVAPEGADAPGRPPKFTRGRLLPCGSAFTTKLSATSHDTGAGEALQEAGGGALVGTEQWAQPVSNMHGGEKTGEQRLGFGNSGTEAPPWIYSSTPRERGPHTICTLASGPSSGER